jgi:hypothetical protein
VVLLLLPAALFNTAVSIILAASLNKISPALTSKRWGRILLAVLCWLVSPFVFSGLFSGAAVVFIAMACQATEQWRYQADWA